MEVDDRAQGVVRGGVLHDLQDQALEDAPGVEVLDHGHQRAGPRSEVHVKAVAGRPRPFAVSTILMSSGLSARSRNSSTAAPRMAQVTGKPWATYGQRRTGRGRRFGRSRRPAGPELERTTGFDPATPTLARKKFLDLFTSVPEHSSSLVSEARGSGRPHANDREPTRIDQIGRKIGRDPLSGVRSLRILQHLVSP
jgi:hypothetical protein